MFEHVARRALNCLLWLALTAPAAADTTLRGQVVSVAGGDVVTIVDDQDREHKLRLAFIDAPELGQPFGDEAQSALAAMVLGREVVARLVDEGADGAAQAEVVEPHGHSVNLELIKRGLAWHDYFDTQAKSDRDRYQAALSAAQTARQGMWALDRVELPRDFRARVERLQRWWLYVAVGLAGFTMLGLIFTKWDKRITGWIERQEAQTRAEGEAYRLARIQAEAEQAEKDRTREIANREMDRLAAIRQASSEQGPRRR
ncbi:thermonuclease family protein [Roseateles microcysteis]|uniref:thermonuclease family protein n=1 Tax=Roseateles microcysteis TaxID=3119057 RepID=UPI002FE5DF37